MIQGPIQIFLYLTVRHLIHAEREKALDQYTYVFRYLLESALHKCSWKYRENSHKNTRSRILL